MVGDNHQLLVFPLAELNEMSRGRGVRLQKYKDGGLAAPGVRQRRPVCALAIPRAGCGRSSELSGLPWLACAGWHRRVEGACPRTTALASRASKTCKAGRRSLWAKRATLPEIPPCLPNMEYISAAVELKLDLAV